jgi:hypothetical protein
MDVSDSELFTMWVQGLSCESHRDQIIALLSATTGQPPGKVVGRLGEVLMVLLEALPAPMRDEIVCAYAQAEFGILISPPKNGVAQADLAAALAILAGDHAAGLAILAAKRPAGGD